MHLFYNRSRAETEPRPTSQDAAVRWSVETTKRLVNAAAVAMDNDGAGQYAGHC
jgi:hypothetical protein